MVASARGAGLVGGSAFIYNSRCVSDAIRGIRRALADEAERRLQEMTGAPCFDWAQSSWSLQG